MWLKTLDKSGNTSLVNLDKVHHIEIYEGDDCDPCVWVYFGCVGTKGCIDKIPLYSGSIEECRAYMKSLHTEIDICGNVLEYQEKT